MKLTSKNLARVSMPGQANEPSPETAADGIPVPTLYNHSNAKTLTLGLF
jgi:hypothetical protein